MPGMSAGMMLDSDAQATPEMIAYYVERAKTRPGLMAIGASAVVPASAPRKMPLALDHDRRIPSLKKLVDAVHQYDTKFGIQTVDEIGQVVSYFAAAARRCQTAGFDFVEIHAGHGYLISAFLTPHFNRRTDQYGGCLENRGRFLLEILRAVKSEVGHALAVGVKINGDDFMVKDGWTLADTCTLAPTLEDHGADYLSITAGVMGGTRLTVPPLYEKQGCFADLAEAVKKAVSIPVATVGRIKNPAMANDLLEQAKADIICMGRAIRRDR